MLSLSRILAAVAALFLGGGVALAAYAAHAGVPNLVTASQFLMIQGAALLGGTAAVAAGLASARMGRLALLVVSIGTLLFCGDLVLRGLDLGKLFPMAAPAGGLAMIGGWTAFAATVLLRRA
jgi:uncharacterized membrane protein YgdD (TMEM256/DUF423 family)